MKFTDELWQSTLPIYDRILQHPFIEELTAGTLSRERFVFYMQQDSLYLRDFSRSLALTGARLPDVAASQSFFHFAHSAISVERLLHETYFVEFGVTAGVDHAPACFAYTNYLLAMATSAPYNEAAAALLPCFWVYREVGREIVARSEGNVAGNPYARWIETYSGVEYDESVTRAIEIVDEIGGDVSQSEREAMSRAFEKSVRLEWMFWDSAYRLEQWPPVTG